ncbi:MAG: PAS domain-containing protein, partial [Desulfurobacteriaceae bacterium]
MEGILLGIVILLATLIFILGYLVIKEREKRRKLIEQIRKKERDRESKGFDKSKLLTRALSLIREGIVIMDPYGRIVFTNKLARELLDISPEDAGKFFYQAIKNFDVVSMINESFNKTYRVWQEKKIKDRYVQMIFGSDMDEKVLLLID